MSEENSAANDEPQNDPVLTSGASPEGGEVNTPQPDPSGNPLAPENPPEHPNAPAPGPSSGGDLPPAAATGPDPEPPELETAGDTAEQDEDERPVDRFDTARVTVTAFSQTKGVELIVNGREFHFPIGKPVDVPGWVLPSLAAIGDAKFTVE